MNGIFPYIYHQNQPNIGKYTNQPRMVWEQQITKVTFFAAGAAGPRLADLRSGLFLLGKVPECIQWVHHLVGGFPNPFEKYAEVTNGFIFPLNGGESKNIWVATT